MEFTTFKRVATWQEIALALLKKYTEHFYAFKKRNWELPHLEVRYLEPNDPNLLGVNEPTYNNAYYRILVDKSEEEIIEKLKDLKTMIEREDLKTMIEREDLKTWEFRCIQAIWFSRHLFQPLIYCDSTVVEISPAPLNPGEQKFILDLKEFYTLEQEKGAESFFNGKNLYLLRNLSKGKGVGFFEAGNFHPDFIVWVVSGNTQHVIFIDPKGIRNLSFKDPKIEFYNSIKEIQNRLNDPELMLNSYIVSNTPSSDMSLLWGVTKEQMLQKHIVFQEEDRYTYIRTILTGAFHDFRFGA
jgi:hypothetical protein